MNLNVGIDVNLNESLNDIIQRGINNKAKSIIRHVITIFIYSLIIAFALIQKNTLNEMAIYQMLTMVTTHLKVLLKLCKKVFGTDYVEYLNYIIPFTSSIFMDIKEGKPLSIERIVIPAIISYHTSTMSMGNHFKKTINFVDKHKAKMQITNKCLPLLGKMSVASQILNMVQINLQHCLVLLGELTAQEVWYTYKNSRNFIKLRQIKGNKMKLNKNARKLLINYESSKSFS